MNPASPDRPVPVAPEERDMRRRELLVLAAACSSTILVMASTFGYRFIPDDLAAAG